MLVPNNFRMAGSHVEGLYNQMPKRKKHLVVAGIEPGWVAPQAGALSIQATVPSPSTEYSKFKSQQKAIFRFRVPSIV